MGYVVLAIIAVWVVCQSMVEEADNRRNMRYWREREGR